MLGTYKSPTTLENYINNAFLLYKDRITNNFLKEINDEELKGESCRQYNFSFYLALYLVVLVYKEVLKYPNNSWDYFITKYNLKESKKCLACNGINLDEILQAFTLPTSTLVEGINGLEVEQTFEVEPTDLTPIVETIVIIDLLTILNIDYCINKIN